MKGSVLFRIVGCLLGCFSYAWAQVPSPEDFLGYPLGSKFTWHHQVTDYVEMVGEVSDRVQIQTYGETYEGRPLMLAFISTPENLAELETLRLNNLRATGLLEGAVSGKRLPIVWLSYNIHGNESVSSEVAMQVLHYFATQDTGKWLEEMVVVIDPCVNPDGRDRYVNWYKQARHATPQLAPASYEHREPWPGGRYNHYLFDLNRDWAWQSQQESAQRSVIYQQWMPQVHVDFHEMGAEEPYFFAPAAHPLHEVITDWQKTFQEKVGRNNARYFDREGWLYFTGEVFDLLYPSYGDTWPTYQGAIGFTYEQGGSSRAGLAYLRQTGDTLTLRDRMDHHYINSLSTVETSFRERAQLLRSFDRFFSDAQQGKDAPFAAYVISGDNPLGQLNTLRQLLDRHQIRYGAIKSDSKASGYIYQMREVGEVKLKTGDLLIPARQPQGNLIRVLFEPDVTLEDSLTYDLTAWALPYAFGVDAYALKTVPGTEAFSPAVVPTAIAPEGKAYAYLIPWEDTRAARWMGDMMQAGWQLRLSETAFTHKGQNFEPGTLIAARADNGAPGFDDSAILLAQKHGLAIYPVTSGLNNSGPDLGSGAIRPLTAPTIGLILGDGVSPSRFGELWYYFEQELAYPIHTLHTRELDNTDLSAYDVIILPEGRYDKFETELYEYVRAGGKMVALGRAISLFTEELPDFPPTALAEAIRSQGGLQRMEETPGAKDDSWLKAYGNRIRTSASEFVPGSIFEVKLDPTHPLAFGLGDIYFSLKDRSRSFPYLQDGGWNVGVYPKDALVSGFAGHKTQKEIAQSLAIGTERYGQGQLVYLVDAPFFRAFWHGGKLLLANAIFF